MHPPDVIVFDFDGAKIALDRRWATANGMSWRKPEDYWKVTPPYRSQVHYRIDNLPAPVGTRNCDVVNLLVFASKVIPSPLSDEIWMHVPAEPTAYPGVVRLTQGPIGRANSPGGPNDWYRLEDKALQADNGAYPVMVCGRVVCRVTLEIQAPLFAKVGDVTRCGMSTVIGKFVSVRKQLRARMENGPTLGGTK